MGEVVSPFGHVPVPGVVDQEIVEKLETFLSRARRGEVTSLAFAYVMSNGTIGTGWMGVGSSNDTLGAIAALQARYTKEWLDHSNTEER